MKRSDFKQFFSPLVPPLYGYALALVPHEHTAETLLLDVYSVFLEKNKKEIKTSEKNKVYVYNTLLKMMWDLAKRRYLSTEDTLTKAPQLALKYCDFYELGLHQRAILFMKEKLGFNYERIQKVLGVERVYIIECVAKAKVKLLVNVDDKEVERLFSSEDLDREFQIQLFIEKRLDARRQKHLQDLIVHDPRANKIYEQKLKQHKHFQSKIPFIRPELNSQRSLAHKINEITQILWKEEKTSVAKKVMKVLDTTVFHLP